MTRVKLNHDKHDATNDFLSNNIELKPQMDELLNNSTNASQKSAFIERLEENNHLVWGETFCCDSGQVAGAAGSVLKTYRPIEIVKIILLRDRNVPHVQILSLRS